MVRYFIDKVVDKIESMHKAALILAFFSLCSQILALMRDRLLAHHFGTSSSLDVYYAAFKIPDLIFVTVASIVSISVMVPMFAKKQSEGEKHLKEATDSVFTVFSVTMVLVCLAVYITMPFIIKNTFHNFNHDNIDLIVYFSRILLLSPLFLGFSNFFGSIVQYERRFILYSISPILYNFGILFGIVFLTESMGVSGVVVGVVFGALLHLFMQAVFVYLSPLKPKFVYNINWAVVWETIIISVPRTLALSIVSFVSFILTVFASHFADGSIAIFTFALNLQSVPMSLIGVSFSVAAFPSIAISFAKKDIDEVILKISDGLRHIIFWSSPVIVIFVLLRAHIVRVLLGSGVFDWQATRLTAACLAIFVLSSCFQSLGLFLSRSHYALGKTKLPFWGNVFGGLSSIFLYYYFGEKIIESKILSDISYILNVDDLNYKILSLPLVYSIGSFFTCLFLLFSLDSKYVLGIWENIKYTMFDSFVSSFVLGFVLYIVLVFSDKFFNLNTFTGVFGHAVLSSLVGIMSWLYILYIIKNDEIREVVRKMY